ncbi:MAG: ABC transporter permease [Anaerolineales bacterium]|nr:ABC transporter permease [Anaerolineales bacterium]
MGLLELAFQVAENLGRRKGRVALTSLGVVIGTGAIVILVSLGEGLHRNALAQMGSLRDLTTILVFPKPEPSNEALLGGTAHRSAQQRWLDERAVEELALIPGVTGVFPYEYLAANARLTHNRLDCDAGMLLGVAPGHLTALGYTIEAGTAELQRGTAVLGSEVVKNFVNSQQRPGQGAPLTLDLIGKTIQLTVMRLGADGAEGRRTITVRVIGTASDENGEANFSIYMPVTDVVTLNQWVLGQRGNADGFGRVTVKVAEVDDVLAVAEVIGKRGFRADTAQQAVQGISGYFQQLRLMLGLLGGITLLVAALSIANTMTTAILERTREIGLMKAIGATNRDVLMVFLGESAGIGFVGGLGGVAGGWLFGQLANVFMLVEAAQQAAQGTSRLPPAAAVYMPPWLAVFALVFATLVGLVSGIYPALRAANLVPIIALKAE